MGQKTSDFSAIPVCAGHYREAADSYHRLGEHGFAQEHRIDLGGSPWDCGITSLPAGA
jgi:hypothetical protein